MSILDFFKKKNETKLSDKDRTQFTNDMIANANLLVNQFNNETKALLDFSVDSLLTLDQIIGENTIFYKKADNETKRKMIIKIGAYIFEVARKNFGGVYYWHKGMNQPILVTGQPEFETSLLAYEKVEKRFKNGNKENIFLFFEGYIDSVKQKRSEVIV